MVESTDKRNEEIMPHFAVETHRDGAGESDSASLNLRRLRTARGSIGGSHPCFSEAFSERGSIPEVMNAIYDVIGEQGGQFDQFLLVVFRNVPQ